MIKSTLEKLSLTQFNYGVSTGCNHFDSKNYMESYYPVDGNLIGNVSIASEDDYERIITTAQTAFKPAPKPNCSYRWMVQIVVLLM